MQIIQNPVNVYTSGHKRPIRFIVIHYTSAKYYKNFKNDKYNIKANLALFSELGPIDKFSAHFMIDRTGAVYQMVDIKNTAYHAGKSIIAIPVLFENINDISVGIELLGDTGDPYTSAQYLACAELCVFIEEYVKQYKLGLIEHIIGHDWIGGELSVRLGIRTDSTKKVDPGPHFDYNALLREKFRIQLRSELRSEIKAELTKEIESGMKISDILRIVKGKI